MHRKLITSYQCYKLLLSGRHINQLSQKSVLKSSLIGHSRFLSSSQSSEGDGGSRTSPATADGQSQSEVKESKDAVRKEVKEVKRDDQLHAAVVGEPVGEPQLHATAVEEPQLHATAVGEPVGEPQLKAAAVGESVGETQLHATAVGEPQVQAAAVGEPVGEPQLQAAVVGEPAGEPQLQAAAVGEPQVQAAAVGEPVGEPELQAAAVGEPQVQAAAVGEPQLQAAAVGEPQVQAAAEPVGEPQLRDAAIGELVGQPQVQAAAELLGEPQLRDAAAMAAVSQIAMEAACNMAATLQAESSPASAQEREAKGGKKSLLELLGAMKVDVTTKRKVRTPRPLQSEQPMKSKTKPTIPVARDTTKGMFQEASAAAAAAAAVEENVEKYTVNLLLSREQTHFSFSLSILIHSNIIADMKVGRRANGRLDARPSNQIRFDEDGRGYTHDRGITSELDGVRRRKSGFTGRRLNVFTTKPEDSPAVDAGLSLWDLDLGNRIAMATNQLPRNGFEEMLLWTKQGTFWQYPINNEAGLEEESSVPFHEHVFMEKHLSEGFPSQGPVRHFMELVVAGLAKNPYLTANQKQEHIAWFRGYFQEKQGVLEEAEVYNS
ncbi:28S ribosomal protein S31, mitochondrial [Alosa alosa]|uniref:28S ribosomal protein S31, mitochondrial n=1 Tax=Alosa alosa TaxID=278164 RepID=UPI002015462C|nr:28S ribosomal protein S31, mitochondrial [Alosa alosa]